MKIYHNPQVERALLKRMQEMMDDPTRGPDGPWHASDIFSCARQSIHTKRHGKTYDRRAYVRFMFGFAIEAYLFHDEAGSHRIEYDGVLLTPDGVASNEDILEMKTTGEWINKFDPASKPHWIERTQAYCAVRGVSRAHVAVVFLHQRDYKAWTMEFTDEELAESKRTISERRVMFDKHRAAGTLPGVETRRHKWECSYCPFRDELDCDRLAGLISMEMPKRAKGA